MDDNTSLTRGVVAAVAEVEGVDPEALHQPLCEVIDSGALNRLFRDTTGHVQFEYHGYDVTVSSDGDVSLESPTE